MAEPREEQERESHEYESDLETSRSDDESDLERAQSSKSARTRREDGVYRTATNVLTAVRSGRPIPPFKHPLAHQPTNVDVIVEFEGPDDPYRSLNWPFRQKFITTLLYGFTAMGSSFHSSVYSSAVPYISREFEISDEVSTLGISLFLIGLGLGPLLWSPLSEVYGRKWTVLVPYFISGIFAFATGAAKDVQTIMICRFFAGFFGAAPVTNTGGVLGDLWSPQARGTAIAGYSVAVCGGPTLGPVVGGAIVLSYLGWRWTEYISGILIMFLLTLDILFCEESYPAKLLVYKARRLRHETGNWALHAKHEEWDVSIIELSKKYLVRPFQLLFTPVCFLMALYASFVYGILYASLGAFPVEFQEERGWNALVGSLPFLSLLLGMLCGAFANGLNNNYYVSRMAKNNGRPVPEARLIPMMYGSFVFAGGLFFFAWTSSRRIHWICPCIATVLIGFGFITIFQSALNYIIDTFLRYAASGVGANTFLRSIMAAAFPLFITPMLHNMGIDWGVSVWGFFSAALIPVPYFFFFYGKRIRARSKWSRDSV